VLRGSRHNPVNQAFAAQCLRKPIARVICHLQPLLSRGPVICPPLACVDDSACRSRILSTLAHYQPHCVWHSARPRWPVSQAGQSLLAVCVLFHRELVRWRLGLREEVAFCSRPSASPISLSGRRSDRELGGRDTHEFAHSTTHRPLDP
jgi:hypothetical protein